MATNAGLAARIRPPAGVRSTIPKPAWFAACNQSSLLTWLLSSGDGMRSEFQELAYRIVHQLKEPTRSIRTGIELLLESGVHTDTSEFVDRVLRGAMRL